MTRTATNEATARGGERRVSTTTVSGVPVNAVYGPADLEGVDLDSALGSPGQPPYTRGIHAGMYRTRGWTMRQFSGFGTAEDTNARFRYLLDHGQTGLSVAFHLPTLMGVDSDHPMSEGEVGKCGVAIDSLEDMETLFEGIPLDRISTSMTTNAPAPILWAMYLAVAEKQDVDWSRLSGTIQNDLLKEYIAQKTYIFPPRPSMKMIVDTFEFGARRVPRWNTISISGYHIREAGATALQELAFTLYDGIEYVEWARRRGLEVDAFAPRLSFFFNAHNDLFEEVAKYRAARKVWYRVMRERFGAADPRSTRLRFHAQTAGCSLTAQQPHNNVVRTAIQALAAVLGGTQSLHTNSLDETLALPTEHAARIALQTQQIIAEEIGVTRIADPLGGSYYLERLTRDMEEGCWDYFRRLDDMGGMVAAIEQGFPQREIQDAAYAYQKAIETNERVIVGVNDFQVQDSTPIDTLKVDRSAARRQKAALGALRERRDSGRVRAARSRLSAAARSGDNIMEPVLDCVRAYATLGEICDTLRDVHGVYAEPGF